MNPDDLKPTWERQTSPTRLGVDPDLLLQEVRHNQRTFAAILFWRDFQEVGTCLVLLLVWPYLGIRGALPWTWYLMLPALMWTAGFMLVDRHRHSLHPSQPGQPLLELVASSLAQVEHQIWLLRHVHWWYLLPITLAMLAFLGHSSWQNRGAGWAAVLLFLIVAVLGLAVFTWIYSINQVAVRTDLEPRRQELQTLLASLGDEPPNPSG